MKTLLFKSAITLTLIIIYSSTFSQVLTTIAGNGTVGYSGDGGKARNASLNGPIFICLDQNNNVFVSDYKNNVVRRIDAVSGIITTIAGNGLAGFAGDGGLAVNAQLNKPFWIKTDKKNNLYIVDYNNKRVRKVDFLTGIISTIAGNGNGTEEYLDGGVATEHGLLPLAIAFDSSENLYISQHPGEFASTTTNIVSKLNKSTGIITTYAGNGRTTFNGDSLPALQTSFDMPEGMCFDNQGNFFVVERGSNTIRKIDAITNIVTTVAGNKNINYYPFYDTIPALGVNLQYLSDLSFEKQTNTILFNEVFNIRRLDVARGIIANVAGIGNGSTIMAGDCYNPAYVSIDECLSVVNDSTGNIYFTDVSFNRIRKIVQGISSIYGGVTNIKPGNWDDPDIWCGNAVPVKDDWVVINFDVNINQDVECKYFQVNKGKVIVKEGVKVNVHY